jgi:hypothetical protein
VFLKGKRMRALLMLVMLVGLAALGGCATMTRSGDDNWATFERSVQYDMRQMAEDFNYVWMLDRPSRLSRWVMR